MTATLTNPRISRTFKATNHLSRFYKLRNLRRTTTSAMQTSMTRNRNFTGVLRSENHTLVRKHGQVTPVKGIRRRLPTHTWSWRYDQG